MGRRVMRRPQMLMNRKLRQLNRNVGRTLAFGGAAAVGNKLAKEQSKPKFKPAGSSLRKNSRLPNDREVSSDSAKENPISNNKKQSNEFDWEKNRQSSGYPGFGERKQNK